MFDFLLLANLKELFLENWDLLLKTLGVMISAVMAFIQWKRSKVRLRNKLKTDLEILELMGNRHEQYALVQATIRDGVERIYGIRRRKISTGTWFGSGFAFIFSAGFTWWTVSLLTGDDNSFQWKWWALVTGFIAFVSFSLAIAPILEDLSRDDMEEEMIDKETQRHASHPDESVEDEELANASTENIARHKEFSPLGQRTLKGQLPAGLKLKNFSQSEKNPSFDVTPAPKRKKTPRANKKV